MAYYIDTNKISITNWEEKLKLNPCVKHDSQPIYEDSGEVWHVCTHCNKILKFENIAEPIIKYKRKTIRA